MYGAGTGNLTVLTRTVTGANQTIQVISGDQKLNVWRKASVSTPPSPPLPEKKIRNDWPLNTAENHIFEF